MTVKKGNIKEITPTNRNSSKQHDEPIRTLAITCSLFKSRVQCVIAFGFASHWLKTWREIFRPVIKCSNRIPRNNFRQSFEKYTKHHQNPWSYQGDSAIPPFEQVTSVEYTHQEFHFPLFDAAYCGREGEHQVSNGSRIGLFSLFIFYPFT